MCFAYAMVPLSPRIPPNPVIIPLITLIYLIFIIFLIFSFSHSFILPKFLLAKGSAILSDSCQYSQL